MNVVINLLLFLQPITTRLAVRLSTKFRKKTKNQVAPKILIDQPVKKVLLKKDQPYLILWQDNLNGDVSIKLYDGKKLIQNISSRTASDGVYEWTPRNP